MALYYTPLPALYLNFALLPTPRIAATACIRNISTKRAFWVEGVVNT
jgi:hypothetical protein